MMTPGNCLRMRRCSPHLGEIVVKARSGREALEQLLKRDFAVILLDVNMPDMDGFETAAMIRQRPRFEHTPIIFVTAYNTTDLDRLKGYDIGAADYIFLPVIPEVLKAKVRVFVELARQRGIIERQAHALSVQNKHQGTQIGVIQDLNEKLKTANEELEAFSYSVSHDLRSPLRAMQGYAHTLLEDYGGRLDSQATEYLQRINKAAVRMDGLVQDVLSYSRLAKADVQVVPVDLDGLIEEIIRDSRVLSQAHAQVDGEKPAALRPGARSVPDPMLVEPAREQRQVRRTGNAPPHHRPHGTYSVSACAFGSRTMASASTPRTTSGSFKCLAGFTITMLTKEPAWA